MWQLIKLNQLQKLQKCKFNNNRYNGSYNSYKLVKINVNNGKSKLDGNSDSVRN